MSDVSAFILKWVTDSVKTQNLLFSCSAQKPDAGNLLFSTYNLLVEKIASESAELAWNKGSGVIVLPTIPFEVNTGQLDIKLNINLNPGKQYAISDDIY